ncbi:hypothetical protein [Endozoicomonas sp. 8E]|uniref:hypothetical protein n=1 Tax=Endozoicomonas sp. 8E TaxID=3035692 RepID=UPI00293921CB|nr:hypothetical protein [Endozoicomonas sp. 8E]WOG29255.1 hypothetical protein P6910_06230 [Endozoicomonas sp. 8E]
MLFGDSLHALELVGSSPLPVHFLYSNKLAEPEQPDSFRGCHELTPVIPGFILVIPAKAGIHTDSPPEPYCPVPPWPCHPREGRDPPLALDSRLRGNDDLRAWERAVGVLRQPPERGNELLEFYVPPEVLENTSNGLITRGAAVGDDGDKPPDGNSGSPDPEPQPDLTFISDPVQTCLQQKKQLLIILQIKRLWAIMTGQTTLARILSDRIMVIEADLLDLERSDPGTIEPGLVQTWLAENGQELRVYREMVSGKYSGRQVGNGKKNQSSRTIKASTTATASQTGQTSGSAARNKGTGSTGANGRGGDDPLKPSAEQNTGHSLVACSKCDKVLNPQELERVANQTAATALLCNKCLSGIQGNKRVRRIREEAEPDSPEPAPKKKKGPARKRNSSTAVAEPAAKKKKPAVTQIPDDPLEKIKANIKYALSQEELKKVQTLVAVFKKKNITVKNTFYKLLGFVDRDSFNGFFDNAAAFFGHLSKNVKNTGMLTGMLNNSKKHIRSFAERSQNELEYLASLDVLNSFSSMNNGKGVPTHEQVKAILGWPEWKDRDGEFNTKLFRSFSSMNRGKGMLKHEQVKEVQGWPEWKDKDGEFSMELFRAFSSMNSGKGMLKHKQVEEVLSWPEWKDKGGDFSMELFRAFSSMNCSKGVLTHEQVKEVLSWPEWRDKDGEFSMELFRSFSSMNNGKGVFKKKEAKEVLGWPEWKDKDGEFSMELFRSFSSMNSGKGMLKQKEVKKVLGWPEWKDKDGEFSMELFRAFSSMNHGKGMLKQEEAKEVLNWTEWKDWNGEFNTKLFRSFSSMNNGKGMPKHEQVKEVLGWPEWKDEDGEFSIELFRSFSSMNSGKGMLNQEEVKEVLGWPEWKEKDGEFSMELFRAFSSMNSSKGMIKHEEVKEVLSWPEWKDKDGEFSMELFRSFSSMKNRKGVLKKKEVKEVLGWPEWKDKDGEFSTELLRAFSSMNHGKGILKHEQVKEVLGWPEWKDKDGEFSMELFRSFSSMNSSKGMIKHEEVKEVLSWLEWKDEDGEFNMELFRSFSSMNSSKGMIKHEEVKEVLGWPEWKDKDGEFNMELFRAFSSMNSGKGMLKQEEVKEVLGWPEWKDKDGEFSMELLRAFSSMNHGKGMLRQKEVKEILGWPEWKDTDGEFSMELFRAFSSMNHGKGMLKQKEVKEVLGWPEWKHKGGELNIKLLRIFSSMSHGQGLPKHESVKKVLDWVGCRGAHNHRLLQIMPRLWASEGLPATKMLQHWETQLKQLLLTELTGEHSNPDNEGDNKYNREIKTVALYLSTPKPDWSLKWTVLKQFCQLHKETETLLMLESLIGFLSSSGGKSVKRYLQANQRDRHFLWRHSMKAVPLRVLNRAMLLCSCDEDRERFVYFAKRLKSLPDKRLWEQYSAVLQPLSAVLKLDSMQRLYLEILQPLTKNDQLRFLDASHAQAVFDLFPSLSALQKLSKEHSSHWLSKLLEACLQLKTHDINKEGIQILFEALLKTHSLLPWDNDIPVHFLSGMRTNNNNHVEIPVSGLIQSGEQLALSYIAVLMQNLNEMSFTVKGQWLEVEVPGDDVQNYRCPMPQLEIQDEKMTISNWSEKQFRTFLKITGIFEHYYLTPDQWQKHSNPDNPVYVQRRKARLTANKEPRAKSLVEATSFNPLPIHILVILIKEGMVIKPVTWKSFDHHKERLPESLLCRLRERIETSDIECPDEIRESLTPYLNNVQFRQAEAYQPENELEPQKQAFGSLWLKLNQTEIFGSEILNLLEEYESEMELMHTVVLLKKAKIDTDNRILEEWRQRACSKIERLKKQDPLLSDVDPDVYQGCQELELLDGCGSIF